MPSAPKVTVLTPTYNRPAYLADAIRSVVGQQFADWEMLVVNDGGTDVRGIVEGFGDPRISYFNRPENRGKAACLNFGLARARGQYVAYLDDDDIWYPNHLATLAGALDDNPQMGVAYSDLYAVAFLKGEDGRRYPLEKRVVICRDYNRMLMFHFNHTLHVSLMHRRELAVRAGGYDESIRVMIDWDLTRKLSFYTDFLHVRQTTGEYYQPVSGSDRISDLGRRDEETYSRNLRRIRADLPPEPWPLVDKVAVVFPVSRWDDTAYDVIGYLLNKLDYPCRVVLVNRDPQRTPEDCRRALGALAELKNLHVESAGADGPLHEAYVAGARSVEANFYYLPSRGACLETGLRLITGLCYMAETRCDAVRWPGDPDADGPYDVLLRREALFSARPPGSTEGRPQAHVLPEGWMPQLLRTDYMLHYAQQAEEEGNYAAAQHFLDEASAVEQGGAGGAYLVPLYASVAFALGDHTRAEAMCRQLIAEGYGVDNWVRLGRICQRQGRYAPALDAYGRGLKEIGLRDEDVEGSAFPFSCAADFDAFHAMVGRGECLLELGRDGEAARVLRRAARLRANSPRPYVAFGRLFLKHGQLDQAEEAFILAARQPRPADDAGPEAGLAQVHERRGEAERAYQWCLSALARSPDCPELLERACGLAGRLGKTDQVAGLYRTFLTYRPAHVPALLGLAEACRLLGSHQEARELAERAAMLQGGIQTS